MELVRTEKLRVTKVRLGKMKRYIYVALKQRLETFS